MGGHRDLLPPQPRGLLTGKMTPECIQNLSYDDWRRNADDFQEPKLSKNLEVVELLTEIGALYGKSPAEVAIAWTLRNSAVMAAVVGGRRPDQVDGIIGAADFRLSKDELKEIEAALP